MNGRALLVAAIVAAAAVGLVVGWSAFWFLCDDAYIAFRYVSNSRLGWGYTWNPPPFQPVEGYTSFLWVALLDLVWRVLDVAPPDAANAVSLGFSFGSLGVIAAMALRMRLSERLERFRPAILALVLLSTVSNRTFLAWTSSGLETAMFSFLMLAWTWVAVLEQRGERALGALSLLAGLLSLARPDGLLFVGATVAVWAWRLRPKAGEGARGGEERLGVPRLVVSALPLLLPVLHVAWRWQTYGWPLPNTYYAKHVGAWPVAGVLYAISFALEYAYWVWLVVLGLAAVGALRRFRRDGPGVILADTTDDAVAVALGVAAVLGHWAYYTLLVGGDHFEYRVYHHLVPLLPLSLVWLADRLSWPAARALGVLSLMVALGWPVPWIHWAHTKDLVKREQTYKLRYKVAPHLPWGVRWYGLAFDGVQEWLIDHFVGLRHQGHKVFLQHQFGRFPTREEGEKIRWEDGHPVYSHISVGVPGWVLPEVAIVDRLGLNDVVIAHGESGERKGQFRRMMAHDRRPPKGYVQCFRPNVDVADDGTVTVRTRQKVLTDQQIRDCESRYLLQVLED